MVKRILRWLGIVIGLLIVALAGLAIHVARTWDRVYDAPLPQVQASIDPAVIARGEYLVYGPAHCVQCHGSTDSLQKLAQGEKVPLSGGVRLALGPLGAMYARNLTPDPETGIGGNSDAEIARMMRWSIRPDGRATLGPMMPYGNMSDDDLAAIIVSARAAAGPERCPGKRVDGDGQGRSDLFTCVQPATTINPPTAPAQAATVERGEYLARYVANCVGCHTPRDQMTFAATGPDFSGGMEFEPMPVAGADPAIWFRAPNLTPAPGSALTDFPGREFFVARFERGGREYAGSAMPWEAFSRMTAEDLGALYEFLRSVPPADDPTGDPRIRRTE